MKRRFETGPCGAAALFNTGLCHSPLPATATGAPSPSQTECDVNKNYSNGADVHEGACAMLERLLRAYSTSRTVYSYCEKHIS